MEGFDTQEERPITGRKSLTRASNDTASTLARSASELHLGAPPGSMNHAPSKSKPVVREDSTLIPFMAPIESLKASSVIHRLPDDKLPLQGSSRKDTKAGVALRGRARQPQSGLAKNLRGSGAPSSVLHRLNRRRKDLIRSSAWAATPPLFGLLTIFGLTWAAWYRDGRLAHGYCPTGVSDIPSPHALPGHLSLPSNALFDRYNLGPQPACLPCPPNGFCSHGRLDCAPDFLRQAGAFGLGIGPNGVGLVPVSERCDPDPEKEVREARVASRALSRLKVHRGEVECAHIAPVDETCDHLGVIEDDLKNELYAEANVR